MTILGAVQKDNSRLKINIKDLKLEKELREAEINGSSILEIPKVSQKTMTVESVDIH